MGKSRMNLLDVRAVVKELQTLVGLRVANIYNLSAKTYVIKFSSKEKKIMLLMESGTRLHITEYEREKDKIPSNFCMKLRKHIRQARLESLQMIGLDRVVDLKFGTGEAAYHIIFELYASGNLILTDHELNIVVLLRTHSFGKTREEETDRVAVREKYPLATTHQTLHYPSTDELRTIIEAKRTPDSSVATAPSSSSSSSGATESSAATSEPAEEGTEEVAERSKKKNKDEHLLLKNVLAESLQFGTELVEHCMIQAGIKAKALVTDDLEAHLADLSRAIQGAGDILTRLGTEPLPGFIAAKLNKVGEESVEVYLEFLPILLAQHDTTREYKGCEFKEFPTFNAAVDEFFSKQEAQKDEVKVLKEKGKAWDKVERVKEHHRSTLESLQKEQDLNRTKAELIEGHLEVVDAVINTINIELAKGMDWTMLSQLVKEEAKKGNVVARLISQLKLATNHVIIQLSPGLSHLRATPKELAQNPELRPVDIDLDLAMPAYPNAARYFQHKKKLVVKEEKTAQASEKAIRAAEKKTTASLKQVDSRHAIQKHRKVHWFEKFHWFITSENYLVIGGRDAQQNEQLVKKYLNENDVYVHAEVHGASSVIIKNNKAGGPIPPISLGQAGVMCVCHSSAWKNKVAVSAYWVYSHQVSKSAPPGEYLTTGSFMIRGKKNFIPHVPLIMSFGLLFRLDESCVAHHVGERKQKAVTDEPFPEEAEDSEPDMDVTSQFVAIHHVEDGEPTIPSASVTPQEKETKEEPESEPQAESEGDSESQEEAEGDEEETQQEKPQDTQQEKKQEVQPPKETKSKPQQGKKQESEKEKPAEPPPKQKAKKQAAEAKSKAPEPKEKGLGPKEVKRLKQKAKKLEKYKEQDDEDREIASQLFGLKLKLPAQETAAAPTEAETKPAPAELLEEKSCYGCKAKGHLFKDCPQREEGDTQSVSKAKKLAEAAEQDELKQLMAEENIAEETMIENELDTLTGQPRDDDVVKYAIPVCAPYSAMLDYRFKMKVVPGNQKKGQACKAAVETFLHAQLPPGYKDVIRALGENEMMAVLPSGVKLGGSQGGNKKKNKKKGPKDSKD